MTPHEVMVVGDSMLDRYWHGVVDRISPEVPVPVLRMLREDCRPGGAANVAANIVALGCRVELHTIWGVDEAGNQIADMLAAAQVTTWAHECDMRTTQKIRPVAGRHHLARIDFDGTPTDGCIVEMTLCARLAIGNAKTVVLSDYAGGTLRYCQQIISAAPDGCRVLVDPKGEDFTRYSGAWLLKPNEKALRVVVGEWSSHAEMVKKAQVLRDSLGVKFILVTRGEAGMDLIGPDGAASYKAEAREVFDVCGAGDTVIATVAAMLARGYDLHQSILLANKAAGIVVGRLGASSVTFNELIEE
jgi:D-glycero-beta-D-manno-heptose-7-phosphate kinase